MQQVQAIFKLIEQCRFLEHPILGEPSKVVQPLWERESRWDYYAQSHLENLWWPYHVSVEFVPTVKKILSLLRWNFSQCHLCSLPHVFPLLHSDETPLGILHPSLGPPSLEVHRIVEASPEAATKMIRGMKHLFSEERLRKLGLLRVEKRKFWGDLVAGFQCLKRKSTGELKRDFS